MFEITYDVRLLCAGGVWRKIILKFEKNNRRDAQEATHLVDILENFWAHFLKLIKNELKNTETIFLQFSTSVKFNKNYAHLKVFFKKKFFTEIFWRYKVPRTMKSLEIGFKTDFFA